MGTGSFTVEAWYYYDGGTGERHLVSRINGGSGGYALVVKDGKPGLLTLDYWDDFYKYAPAMSAGWNHIVATRSGTNTSDYVYHIYVNGSDHTGSGLTTAGAQSTGNTDVGNSSTDYTRGFLTIGHDDNASADGSIMQARVYNRAISSDEVSASYNSGCGADPSNTTGLVLWDKLDEGIGLAWYAYDYSSYANNAHASYSGAGNFSLQHEQIDNDHAGCISTGTAMCIAGTPTTCLSCKKLGKDLTRYTGSYTDSASLASWLNERYSYSLSAAEWMHTIRSCNLLATDLNLPGNSSGQGDDVNMGDHNQWHFGSGDFTVEAWVYPRALQTGGIVSDEKNTSTAQTGFNLMEASDGSLIFEVAAQNYDNSTPPNYLSSYHYSLMQSSARMNINKWHHIVVLKVGNDTKNWKMYLDDKKIPCTGVNGLTVTGINTNIEAGQGVSNLRIGSHYGGNNGSAYFNGKVKQVRLYGRAIKEEEIQLSYDGGCGADPEDKSQLVLWLPLNEKTGTTVHDLSSYGLTATTNNPYFEEIPSGLNGCLEKLAYCQNNTNQNVADARNYRYAFNGKESDDETYGDGDEYDYGMRIYDPRLGRFMSVDPLSRKYPELTPYQFASNTPIQAIDLDGLEMYRVIQDRDAAGYITKITVVTYKDAQGNIVNQNIKLNNIDFSTSNVMVMDRLADGSLSLSTANNLSRIQSETLKKGQTVDTRGPEIHFKNNQNKDNPNAVSTEEKISDIGHTNFAFIMNNQIMSPNKSILIDHKLLKEAAAYLHNTYDEFRVLGNHVNQIAKFFAKVLSPGDENKQNTFGTDKKDSPGLDQIKLTKYKIVKPSK